MVPTAYGPSLVWSSSGLEASGNIYGTASGGGASGLGTVFKLDTSGNNYSVLQSSSNSDGTTPEGRVVLDGAGNIYGTTYGGGASERGVVFKIDRMADLSTTKSGPFTRAYGGIALYTLRVANGGPHYSTHVVVSDPLPPGPHSLQLYPARGTASADGTTGTVTCNPTSRVLVPRSRGDWIVK